LRSVFKAALRLQPVGYYIFYLIDKFGSRPGAALSLHLLAQRGRCFLRWPLGDRYGRKYIIWFSILGALPFTLALPYAGLFGSAVLSVIIA